MGYVKFAKDLLNGERTPEDLRRALAFKVLGRRRIVHLELTSRCNTSCRACYRSGPLRELMDTTRTMSLEEVAKVLASYGQNEVSSFELSGGENLLHPDCLAIVEMIRKKFPHQEIVLNTNGILLTKDPQLLDAVCNSPLDRVLFSLHGATQETVSVLQPGVSVDKTLEAMRYVAEHSRFKLSVNYVIQEENLGEMLPFLDLIATTPVKTVLMTPMNYSGHRDVQPLDYNELWRTWGLKEKWNAASEHAAELGLQFARFRNLCGCPDDVDVLTADGSMLLCWGNYLVKKYAVGNVLTERPEDIRNRPEFVEFRKARNQTPLPAVCAACWMKGYDLEA